jgi:hypothetical protein
MDILFLIFMYMDSRSCTNRCNASNDKHSYRSDDQFVAMKRFLPPPRIQTEGG